MANQKWTVTMGNQSHLVEIDGGDWAMKGKVKVDNNPVKGWNQWLFLPKEVAFNIEGDKATLKRKSLFASKFDLYFGDKKL